MSTDAVQVLLIEDDEEDYLITKRFLAHSHDPAFHVTWVRGLADAVALLKGGSFDVVLLDLTLPDSQGWETFTTVRTSAPHLPLVLLTGLEDESLGMGAIKEGAQDYLLKQDIDERLLTRTIRYAIERKRAKEQLEQFAEELCRRNEAMADDLKMAREVQQALLPRTFPVFPPGADTASSALQFSSLYRPSRLLGGDFFSVLQVSDTCAAVLVADVMGHGLRAALVAAILRGLVEELKPIASQAAEFMTEMNRGLVTVLGQTEQLIFVTCVYVLVDVARAEISWVRAGHPSPLLLPRASRVPAPLCPETQPEPVLGIDADRTYTAATHPLQAGDALVVFTDGLLEAERPDGELYGLARVCETLAGADDARGETLLRKLLASVESFTGDAHMEDDVCLVGVEVSRLIDGDPAGGRQRGEAGRERS